MFSIILQLQSQFRVQKDTNLLTFFSLFDQNFLNFLRLFIKSIGLVTKSSQKFK